MKTSQIVSALRQMRATPEDAKLYQSILRIASDRLVELSSGETSAEAEMSKKIYTIHELALMNDKLKRRIRELEKELRNEVQSAEN